MIEHKLITFDRSDIVKALEDYYEKNNGTKIDISFDEKALQQSMIKEITVKVVAFNGDRILSEMGENRMEHAGILRGEAIGIGSTGYSVEVNQDYFGKIDGGAFYKK